MSHFEEKVDEPHIAAFDKTQPDYLSSTYLHNIYLPKLEHCDLTPAERLECLDAARAVGWELLRELTVKGPPSYVKTPPHPPAVDVMKFVADEVETENAPSQGTPVEMLINAGFHQRSGHSYQWKDLSHTPSLATAHLTLSKRVRGRIAKMLPSLPESHAGTVPKVFSQEGENDAW